ncbi:TetR/AcrR family transcriptional regulator [Streptomyces zingiberis]|uniref:TetR/AcrR family transcriptional regulator n=1 Tax=Streptomyces zingiberis TaxID=2053010 RepID=A0ABX1C0D7_9ACTN|nr:TetR/AcrR family transcriptional regulator [Streptomyces zingiberis]NJQ02043.1 TetR/AcrR family transcriptional regulator [Streptomyces zingiberis]
MPRTDKITSSTRRRILTEAALLFRRHGYRGTSTRQIAEAVGVKQPSLFHHFANKQSILEELLAISLDPSLAEAREAVTAEGPVARRLYDYVLWDLTTLHRLPFALSGIYAHDVLQEPALAPWGAKLEALYAALRDLIGQGVRSGEFRPVAPGLGQAMVAGVTLSHIDYAAGHTGGDPDELGAAGAAFILGGLMRDPEALDRLVADAGPRAGAPPAGAGPHRRAGGDGPGGASVPSGRARSA